MSEPVLTCPECGSDRVTTEHHQMFTWPSVGLIGVT